ncbi:hypothetical protein FGB62_36g117 [Gracilaria domingensis]|nr:hypothetical protein FGB62_36g117 [Gracilaria domingensis]
MLCENFENKKEVQTIHLDGWEQEDRWCRWTSKERVIWECQNHLLKMVDDDERAYGPADVELMLLFLLGFPVLRVRSFRDAIVLKPVAPSPSLFVALSLRAIDTDVVNIEMKILQERIPILDVMEGPVFPHINFTAQAPGPDAYLPPLEFCWEDWIHMFDGCMKVLSLDFVDEDFCKNTFSGTGDGDDDDDDDDDDIMEYAESDYIVKKLGRGSVTSSGCNGFGQENERHPSNNIWKDGSGVGSVKNNNGVEVVNSFKTSTTSVCENDWVTTEDFNPSRIIDRGTVCEDEREHERDNCGSNDDSNEDGEASGYEGSDLKMYHDADVDNGTSIYTSIGNGETDYNLTEITAINESVGVQRCRCNYRLDRKARRQILPGGNKYYWDWEGWKPQPAFTRYPILYEMIKTDSEKDMCCASEDDCVEILLPLEESQERGEAASSMSGKENVVELSVGEDQV